MKCICGGFLKYTPKYKTLFCDVCGKKEGFYSAISRNLLHLDVMQATKVLDNENLENYLDK